MTSLESIVLPLEQSLARVHRPGQSRPVTYVQLIMTGTVDEKVYAALEAKRDVVAMVLRDMKEGKDGTT